MNNRLCFASDNASGAHPDVIAAIAAANTGAALAYGNDKYTNSVYSKIWQSFNAEPEIYFTFGGTGANVLALGSITRSYEAIYCADCSHVWSDECAAPQKFIGGKIVPVKSINGKINAADVEKCFGPDRGVHHARPRVVSITQPTELGTLYTLEEMDRLANFCHEHKLLLHVDGARFANAAAALGVSLESLSRGIDVLSLGATKNGALGAEAVLYFNRELTSSAGYVRKQTTQLASKMRFLAAQFDALFTNDLWRQNAEHANQMAKVLADGAANCGVALSVPQQINALFPMLTARRIATLQKECDFYVWDEQRSIARWMTSFNTAPEDVERFIRLIGASRDNE